MSATDARASRSRWLNIMFIALCVHAVIMIALYGLVDERKNRLAELYEVLAFLPLQLGSVAALLIAAKRTDLDPGTRKALRWIAYGFGSLAGGSVISIISWLSGRPLPYISWADLVYSQLYPGLILGMRALPALKRNVSRARALVDTLVVVLAIGALIVFAAVFEATSMSTSAFERIVTVLYSAAQLFTLLQINGAVEGAQRTPSNRAMNWLFIALALSVVGDLVFQLMYSTGYRGVNWSRASSIAANLAMIWSGILFFRDPLPRTSRESTRLVPFSPLPILAVTSVALMVIWLSRTGSVRGLTPLIVGILILNVVLVARDMIAARDGARNVRDDAARDAERRLDALVKHSTDAILLAEPSGRLLFASAPAGVLFGVEPDRLVGQLMSQWVVEDDRAAFDEFLARLPASSSGPQSHTWRLQRGDGGIRSVESVGLDLVRESTVGGLVLNVRDVTERLGLEDRLRQAQKLEVVGHLAGGVAHDFNNVLATIMSSAELAQLVLEENHEAQYDLTQIRAAASRGAALTRRLLTFVRLQPVPSRRIVVADMLADIEPLLRRLCGDSIELTVTIAEGTGTVHVDRDELEHILFNLVANARDAMPHGGSLGVEASPVDVLTANEAALIPAPPGRYLSLAVRDHGVGMDDDARRRMFDPFFSSKSGGRGTGLGLIGVRPLVEAAGGGLCVDTRPGAGTRVELLLPQIENNVSETPVAVEVADGVTLAARVLVVEDEAAVRDSVTRLLISRGAQVRSVNGAAEARALISAGTTDIDCVLCDVMMPGETGLEFAAWLKTQHPRLPLLMMSGHTGTALDYGVDNADNLALIRKPFSGDELAERIGTMLGQ